MDATRPIFLFSLFEFILLLVSSDNVASFYLVSGYFSARQGVDYGTLFLTPLDSWIPHSTILFP